MYTIIRTAKFNKDVNRLLRRGYKLALLYEVVKKLAAGETLDGGYKDHALKGKYAGSRECHITHDWLLIYKKSDAALVLVLTTTGTHSDLKFGDK